MIPIPTTDYIAALSSAEFERRGDGGAGLDMNTFALPYALLTNLTGLFRPERCVVTLLDKLFMVQIR